MGRRLPVPEVNAGSMADIAFLLLIFFLVTTTIETDSGIDRKLPPPDDITEVTRKKKNVLSVLLDGKGQLLVQDQITALTDLRETVMAFLDNGGAPSDSSDHCAYCSGKELSSSSDNPLMATITMRSGRETEYGFYITVQNEVVAAYNTLRNREGQRLYGLDYTDMEIAYEASETTEAEKTLLRKQIMHLREMYPLNIIEPLQ